MSSEAKALHRRRVEALRSSLSDAELASLRNKGLASPSSLSLDEIGVLFLLARERPQRTDEDPATPDLTK